MENNKTLTANTWNSVSIVLLKKEDKRETEKFYKLLKPTYMTFFKHDEELFHDFFLKVLSSLNSFNGESQLSSWVYKIGINELGMKRRKDKVYNNNTEMIAGIYHEIGENQEFTIEIKKEFEVLLSRLSNKQQQFIEKYLANKKEFTNERAKFSKLIKRLIELRRQQNETLNI